jgi:hypothetical protein
VASPNLVSLLALHRVRPLDSVAKSAFNFRTVPKGGGRLGPFYVAGCGIFPTESSANPTFTLNALSLRGAEQLVTNWGSIAS